MDAQEESSSPSYHSAATMHLGVGNAGRKAAEKAVKEIQRSDPAGNALWWAYCDRYGKGLRDPCRHTLPYLHKFLAGFFAEKNQTATEARNDIDSLTAPSLAQLEVGGQALPVSPQRFSGAYESLQCEAAPFRSSPLAHAPATAGRTHSGHLGARSVNEVDSILETIHMAGLSDTFINLQASGGSVQEMRQAMLREVSAKLSSIVGKEALDNLQRAQKGPNLERGGQREWPVDEQAPWQAMLPHLYNPAQVMSMPELDALEQERYHRAMARTCPASFPSLEEETTSASASTSGVPLIPAPPGLASETLPQAFHKQFPENDRRAELRFDEQAQLKTMLPSSSPVPNQAFISASRQGLASDSRVNRRTGGIKAGGGAQKYKTCPEAPVVAPLYVDASPLQQCQNGQGVQRVNRRTGGIKAGGGAQKYKTCPEAPVVAKIAYELPTQSRQSPKHSAPPSSIRIGEARTCPELPLMEDIGDELPFGLSPQVSPYSENLFSGRVGQAITCPELPLMEDIGNDLPFSLTHQISKHSDLLLPGRIGEARTCPELPLVEDIRDDLPFSRPLQISKHSELLLPGRIGEARTCPDLPLVADVRSDLLFSRSHQMPKHSELVLPGRVGEARTCPELPLVEDIGNDPPFCRSPQKPNYLEFLPVGRVGEARTCPDLPLVEDIGNDLLFSRAQQVPRHSELLLPGRIGEARTCPELPLVEDTYNHPTFDRAQQLPQPSKRLPSDLSMLRLSF
jgi:hypothetical protein